MRGLVRTLVAVSALAVGSWVGLHSSATKVDAPAPAPAPAPTVVAAPAFEVPSMPDTAGASGSAPWPRLNPEADIMKAWRLAESPHRKPGDKRKFVTLTFDDGPFPETTPKVLELLAKYDVKATFFAIGRYLDGDDERARASRETLKKVAEAGHIVGNHGHDHQLLTMISHTQVLAQIDRGAASIEGAIGKKPIFFRPPFGGLDAFGQDAVRERQLDLLLWNVEVQDMERDDPAVMFRELTRQLIKKDGGIVLLHDIRWSSVNILKRLLAYLDLRRWNPAYPEREGYVIADLPTYLRAIEASPPQTVARRVARVSRP